MKQIGLLVLTIAFSFTQVQAQKNKVKDEMAFDKTVGGITAHDFGSIVFGANGTVNFTYTNNSTKPLVITDVKSSCNCTVPTWTKEPVEPGKQGVIEVKYDTQLPGVFNKTIVVYSNAANSPVRLAIMGKVNAKASDVKTGTMDPAQTQVKKEMQMEADYIGLPQDSASKAAAEIADKAKKGAMDESMKKLMEQPTGKGKTMVVDPGTGNLRKTETTTGNKIEQIAADPTKKASETTTKKK